jgi:hypothetical protein
MVNVMDVVDRYVAVWNEPSADQRRKRICSLWAPDGTTCYRLLDARGYDAIETRVTSSWDKWLQDGRYVFRSRDAVCHHGVVKVNWEMVTTAGGEIQAVGLSFLVLTPDGRIQSDYQFNPTISEANNLVDRYVAVWNEPNADVRCSRIAELWAPDGAYINETAVWEGHSAIGTETVEVYNALVAKDLAFLLASHLQAHHNVVSFGWHTRAKDSDEVKAAGSDLLILHEGGRISLDYRYHEPQG